MATFIFFGATTRKWQLLNRLSPPILSGLVLLYSLLTLYSENVNLSVRMYGTSLFVLVPAATIGSLLLMKFSTIIDRTFAGGVLQKIGIHSLPIFCLQIPIINFWERIYISTNIIISPIAHGTLITMLVLATSYPVALIFDTILGKIKK